MVIHPLPTWETISRWPRRILRPNPVGVDDRNAWNLSVEVFWAAILSSAAAFNAAFAVRLGASSTQIGLLTSLPALLAVLVTIPAGRFLEQRAKRKNWILGSLFIHRTGYLLIALLPLLTLAGLSLGAVVVGVLVAMSIPAHFFGVGFNAMLADIVPEKRRSAVFATRNMINASIVSIGVFLAGLWLDRLPFPLNYQLIYGFGYAASLVSLYYLLKIQVADSPIRPAKIQKWSWRRQWQTLQTFRREQNEFVRIVVNTLLHGLAVWAAAPLYILYFVRELGASDAWIGLHGTIANVAAIIGYALWHRLMRQWGESKTLKLTILGVGLYPLLVGFSPALTPILFAVALNGLITPGVGLSHFNTLLKVCPDEQRPSYLAFYTTIMNIGAFVAPLAGVALANRFGLGPTLIGCGLCLILGSASFSIWPIRVADTNIISSKPIQL